MENSILVQISIPELKGLISDTLRAELQNAQQFTSEVKEYLTVSEAANKLSLSKVTIYEYLNKGIFKKSKIGKRTLISVESINAAIKELETDVRNQS